MPDCRGNSARILAVILAVLALACHRRPDFDLTLAQLDLAQAFEKPSGSIQIYGDGRGTDPKQWIVEFRIQGLEPFMEARFDGQKDRWALGGVRERGTGTEGPWESVAVLLNRVKGETASRGQETMARMRALADYIGQYALRNGNRFPAADMAGLRGLIIREGIVQERDWHHDTDGWGQTFRYHAAPDGLGYVVISPGADGELDRPEDEYYANADQGIEAYGGLSRDPGADIVLASGDLVQGFEP